MKRITLVALMLAACVAYAQKPVKPNLSKALGLLQDGKLAEAKEMIDAATTYEKTMNEGNTWYYRGLIYATIDTTSNPAVKSLANHALTVAMESFKKADEMGKKGKEYFILPKGGIQPQMKPLQIETLSNYYLNKGINQIQADEPNYPEAVTSIEKSAKVFETMPKYSNDTLAYYVLAMANYNQEKYDETIAALDKFYGKGGGQGKESYLMLYQIYNGPKENKEKALEAIRKGKAKLPANAEFAKIEIGLLIDLDRVAEAKEGLEKAVAKEPNDKILHFYLAYTNGSLKNYEAAKKHYLEALRLDPTYYEAQYYYSQLYLTDIDGLSKQINGLGISAADAAKKKELYQLRVKKSEEAIPHLEKTERMKTADKEMQIDILEKLKLLYYYTADDAKTKVVVAKLKTLGVTED